MSGDGVAWTAHWESELTPDQHRELSYLLRVTFPDAARMFAHGRSWAGVRPERRLVGRHGGALVAHAGILRRFVRVGGVDQLVGEVGLVGVHPGRPVPDLAAALVDRLGTELAGLRVPFGFSNTRADILPHYRRAGWEVLTHIRTRYIQLSDPLTTVTVDYPAQILPVAASLADWPPGDLIERNGPET